MTTTRDIVTKLWNFCNILRDDGITYHQYVTELTYLLFLKMMEEKGKDGELPVGYRWDDLKTKEGLVQLNFYRSMLLHLGTKASERVKAIYNNAQTSLTKPANLTTLVKNIDALDWYSAREEGLGDLYEGLLQKNANEKKSGAGQYFTPRPLIESMVKLLKPQAGEVIQDPAAGTAGFLIVADRFVKEHTDNFFTLDSSQQSFQRRESLCGVELVPDTYRLALMNAMLHDIESGLLLGDSLSELGHSLPPADVILTNPPFGTKKGGEKPTRAFTHSTSNKQLAFLQHIYRGLKPGGRAAVVLPDNVLFEDNVGQKVRTDLMNKCNLHTILRLPTGIFYAQGVKTNVLFFTRGKETDEGNTKSVWIYDMRTNAPAYGKRTPFTEEAFVDFEKCFGEDPNGLSERKDLGEEGRFRVYSRAEIEKRGDNLDISWLHDEDTTKVGDLEEPGVIAGQIMEQLKIAMGEMEGLRKMLEGDEGLEIEEAA